MSDTGHISRANLGARKPDWRRWRAWGRFLLWLSTPPIAIAVAFQLQPAHVVLDIPVTPHRGVGYFWSEEQLSYADSWGVLYLHRKVGTAYPHAQGRQTAEEAFAHFRLWLTANDRIYAGIGIDNPAVPESRFLKPEQGRRFHRRTDHNIQATVMVWPIGAPLSAFHNSFHVVVTTERPSWARMLQKDLD
jgi:hypothetical protein